MWRSIWKLILRHHHRAALKRAAGRQSHWWSDHQWQTYDFSVDTNYWFSFVSVKIVVYSNTKIPALNLRGNRASERGLNALYHAVKVRLHLRLNLICITIQRSNRLGDDTAWFKSI